MKTTFSVTRKDFDVTWFSGTGAGGQHRNKHQNCCRLKHRETGLITTGQSHRDRPSNQREALQSMAKNKFFMAYCNRRLDELEGMETPEEWVESQMQPQYLSVQIQDDTGRWVDEVEYAETQSK